MTAALLAVSLILVAFFVLVDRRTAVKVLPPSAFGRRTVEVDLSDPVRADGVGDGRHVRAAVRATFGASRVPSWPGFWAQLLAVGWAVSEILSASLSSRPVIKRVVVIAPLVIALGLILTAVTQVDDASVGFVVTWALALTITGIGIGAAWPHLSAWAMQCVDDEKEGAAAAAAINMIEVIAGAFGAGLAGVVVNSAQGGVVMAARALFAVFAALGVAGALAAYRATRGLR